MTPHVKCNEVGQRAAWKQAAWKMGPGACEDRQSRWLNPSPGTPTQKEVRINQTLLLCLRSNLHKGNAIKTAFFLPHRLPKIGSKKRKTDDLVEKDLPSVQILLQFLHTRQDAHMQIYAKCQVQTSVILRFVSSYWIKYNLMHET